MRHILRRALPFMVGGAIVVFAACQDGQAPTEPVLFQQSRGGPTLQSQINQAIKAVWPARDPGRPQAHSIKSEMFQAGQGTAAAQAAAEELIELALASGADMTDVETLINLVSQFSGLAPGQVVEADNGGVVTDDPGNDGFAGVQFEPGALPEDVLVIVETHAQPCHPISQLPNQEDGCFTFRTIPELTGDFAIPVLVGVCTDLELPNLPLLRLFESQGPNDNTPVVLLPEEPTPDFLVDDCLNFGMASTGSSWLGDFARAGWQHVGRPMASLFAPEPLHAATFLAKSGSLGGRTKNFSNIGWAEGGELEYGAEGYRYLELSGGATPPSGFETPGFDDSSWAVGDAPFWDSPGFAGCPAITPAAGVGTTWNLSTHILLRRPFFLPDGATNVKVGIAIDNDVQVWVNGVEVSSGVQQHENCATEDSFLFSVGLQDVTVPGVNVLVVRGIDRGVMSYVDAEVTFDIGN